MRPIYLSWATALLLAACSDDASSPTGSDEESAQQFGKDETYDHTRAGARLILSYDAEANAFAGTVQNTTDATLRQVRVEVHLSNGTELGPTPETDLEPGETIPITLEATSDAFNTWSAHPEVGGGDEGSAEHSGEGDGEHSREGGGEHSGEGGEGGESGGEHSSG